MSRWTPGRTNCEQKRVAEKRAGKSGGRVVAEVEGQGEGAAGAGSGRSDGSVRFEGKTSEVALDGGRFEEHQQLLGNSGANGGTNGSGRGRGQDAVV